MRRALQAPARAVGAPLPVIIASGKPGIPKLIPDAPGKLTPLAQAPQYHGLYAANPQLRTLEAKKKFPVHATNTKHTVPRGTPTTQLWDAPRTRACHVAGPANSHSARSSRRQPRVGRPAAPAKVRLAFALSRSTHRPQRRWRLRQLQLQLPGARSAKHQQRTRPAAPVARDRPTTGSSELRRRPSRQRRANASPAVGFGADCPRR